LGFVPFTEAEGEHLTKEMKSLLVPEMTLIAKIDSQPAGFILAVPDINAALRHIDGRLTSYSLPVGLLKLLYYKSRIGAGRLIALGVVEAFWRAGIAQLVVLGLMDAACKLGLIGELSMTLEDNVMVNRFIEVMGASRYKTYRIYGRPLG
jgi:hypothetical protein